MARAIYINAHLPSAKAREKTLLLLLLLLLGSFRGGKAAGAWNWQSPPSSAEVKNAWSYTSTSPVCPHGVVLISSTGTTLPLLYRIYLIHGPVICLLKR